MSQRRVNGSRTALSSLAWSVRSTFAVFYAALIGEFGWRPAEAALGYSGDLRPARVAIVTIPLAACLYREPATDLPGNRAATTTRGAGAAGDWTLGRALRSGRFWAAFAMWGFGVIGYQIVTTHQVAHALERGFGAVTLGWVFGLGGACTVAGNVIGGSLSDRWGREWVFALGSAIGIAGIGLSACSTGRTTSCSCIGPFLGGWLFDVTGSYQVAFAVAATAIAASAVAAWVAASRRGQAAGRATSLIGP